MKAIDFSCKHDIMIRHMDGTLTPFDVPYYEVTAVNDCTWMIMSSGDYHYLLAGDDMGVAIDTGYGAGNLREYLEGLCGKPVPWVIDTHHHFDHTANNCYFDMAYMAEDALDLASIPYASFEGIDFPKPDYPKTAVGDGDIVPLKGRELEIFRIGDHTPNGIAILDRTKRMLFTGDEIMPNFKNLKVSVEKWNNDLKKLMAHRDEFDTVCGGGGVLPDGIVDIFYEASCRILAGEPSEPAPADMKPHTNKGLEYDSEGHMIYDCKDPHPEDGPKGGFGPKPGMVDYYCRGYKFTYNKDNIRE